MKLKLLLDYYEQELQQEVKKNDVIWVSKERGKLLIETKSAILLEIPKELTDETLVKIKSLNRKRINGRMLIKGQIIKVPMKEAKELINKQQAIYQ